MRSLVRVTLGAVVVLAVLGLVPMPGRADHETINAADPTTWKPVVFLVNGFGGCCVPEDVRQWLEWELWVDEAGFSTSATAPGAGRVAIHESNWNDIDKALDDGCYDPFNPDCSPQPHSFNHFVAQLRDAILALPASVKVVLIGHSLGAEAVLRVAQDVGIRRIDFLGTLDPVGYGGFRVTVASAMVNPTRTAVPSNVAYLFNRWQITNPYPLENLLWTPGLVGQVPYPVPSGKLASNALHGNQDEQNERRRKNCSIDYESWDILGLFPPLLLHANVPYDRCVQKTLEKVLHGRVFNQYPRVIAGGTLPAGHLVGGVQVEFSKPIDPTTFSLDDVIESPSPVTAIEVVPDSDNRQFIVRFDPISAWYVNSPHTLVIGPDIRDVAGHPMDQDDDLTAGEVTFDAYHFSFGLDVGAVPPKVPVVLGLKLIAQIDGRFAGIVLSFDKPLAPSVALDAGNYRVAAAGTDLRWGTRDDVVIPLSSVVYDPLRQTVTLTPGTRLAPDQSLRITVTGFTSYAATIPAQ